MASTVKKILAAPCLRMRARDAEGHPYMVDEDEEAWGDDNS